jgi:hypothetical protein
MTHDHYPLLCDVTADTENTASSTVECWTVFTELLPGNALIKSTPHKLWFQTAKYVFKYFCTFVSAHHIVASPVCTTHIASLTYLRILQEMLINPITTTRQYFRKKILFLFVSCQNGVFIYGGKAPRILYFETRLMCLQSSAGCMGCTGGWMGTKIVSETVMKRKIPICPYRNETPTVKSVLKPVQWTLSRD